MKKIIVIPVTNGLLSAHFGHCEQFYFATVCGANIEKEEMITPPVHEPGLYPKWVKDHGGQLVITGGMGPKAVSLFDENNVEVVAGAPSEAPRTIVEKYLSNSLETSANSCHHEK